MSAFLEAFLSEQPSMFTVCVELKIQKICQSLVIVESESKHFDNFLGKDIKTSEVKVHSSTTSSCT